MGDLWREAHGLRARISDHHPLTVRALSSLLGRPDLKRGELARLIHGNASEVSRHFHRDIGLTLVAYRTRLRLIRFIQLVEGGGRSFLAAAIDAGFGSYSQCHRAFQQAFDCTPRVFFGTGRERRNEGALRPHSEFAHKMRRRVDARACKAWQKCAAATVIGARFSLPPACS